MDHHQDLDHHLDHNNQNILKNEPLVLDLDLDDHGDLDLDLDQNILNNELSADHDLDHGDDCDLDDEDDNNSINGENILNSEVLPDPFHLMDHNNNPPESFSVCQAKVADWLNHHTFIERKTSVKFAITKTLDPTQTRSANRAICLNQRPKLSIIGFRKKPIHQSEGKSKHNNDKAENVRLFRNRSEPGRDYCLLITDPVSPKVSCVGRVGSVRVQGRKAGVWRSVKAAFSNLVYTNRVTKVVA
ncbi:hypothetical protein L6452_14086 [Arctium lappa]|uniref:Uncharacterized protein n=1 Tax=Arctium lappa TaxID=4217 RepID=A0ACB9CK28_ARCLA|nr:hypothetical protein L6452_14086 [Arctium lappa]